MRKAEIIVGEHYAVGRPAGSPRYWERGLVLRTDAARRVRDPDGWHSHTVNDGVVVQYGSGRTDIVQARRVIKLWAVHAPEVAALEENDRRIEEGWKRERERAEQVTAALTAAGFPADDDGRQVLVSVDTAELLLALVERGPDKENR